MRCAASAAAAAGALVLAPLLNGSVCSFDGGCECCAWPAAEMDRVSASPLARSSLMRARSDSLVPLPALPAPAPAASAAIGGMATLAVVADTAVPTTADTLVLPLPIEDEDAAAAMASDARNSSAACVHEGTSVK